MHMAGKKVAPVCYFCGIEREQLLFFPWLVTVLRPVLLRVDARLDHIIPFFHLFHNQCRRAFIDKQKRSFCPDTSKAIRQLRFVVEVEYAVMFHALFSCALPCFVLRNHISMCGLPTPPEFSLINSTIPCVVVKLNDLSTRMRQAVYIHHTTRDVGCSSR
jgi:hypothetical protein